MVDLRYDQEGEIAVSAYRKTVDRLFNQVKVVHRLPGRLRLSVPMLERVPSEWLRYKTDLIKIIKRRQGIEALELSPVTGRVLIHYDPQKITPTRVLQWMRRVATMLCEGYGEAPFSAKQHIAPFLKRMHSQSRLWL